LSAAAFGLLDQYEGPWLPVKAWQVTIRRTGTAPSQAPRRVWGGVAGWGWV